MPEAPRKQGFWLLACGLFAGLTLFIGVVLLLKDNPIAEVVNNQQQFNEKTTQTSAASVTTQTSAALEAEVVYFDDLTGMLCKPEGNGLPAVVYHHGGSGGAQIGGDLEGICRALSAAGIVGFSPLRSSDLQSNEKEMQAALDYLLQQSYVDDTNIGVIGFSRGAGSAYSLAIANTGEIRGMVLMSGGRPSETNNFYRGASVLEYPIQLMVAENDTPASFNGNQNMVEVMEEIAALLEAEGVGVSLTIYPPYETDHGHMMFFEIGDYFGDVIDYLSRTFE